MSLMTAEMEAGLRCQLKTVKKPSQRLCLGDPSWNKLCMRTEKVAERWKVVLTNALYIEAKRREGLTNRTEPEI